MSMVEQKLCDVIEFNPKVKLEKGEEYDFIPMESITPGEKFAFIKEKKLWNGESCTKFKTNDVLFARITPCLDNKKIAVAKVDGKGFGSTEYFVLRAIPNISDKDFIYYLATTDLLVQNAINSYVGASGRQRADLHYLKNCEVKIANYPIQKKIAAILSAYDDLIENNKKRIQILENMAEELYKEWFVRFRFPDWENTEFEKGVPKAWEIEKVSNLVDRKKFGRVYKEFELASEGSVPVIDQSQKNILGFHEGEAEHKASFESPMVIFGDHSCKMQIMFKNFSLAENVIPFKSKGNISLLYLFSLIKDQVETTEYKRHWGELSSKKVLLAPISLQEKYASLILDKMKLIETLKTANNYLVSCRDQLLPRLISGKLSLEDLDIQFPPSMQEQ